MLQANELLLSGRKLTAQEACSKGLVSQVLWPGTFTQEVMLRIKELVAVDSLVSCTKYHRDDFLSFKLPFEVWVMVPLLFAGSARVQSPDEEHQPRRSGAGERARV